MVNEQILIWQSICTKQGVLVRLFESVITRVAYALTIFAGFGLLLMMAQNVAGVLLNNFLGTPIEGNLEIVSSYHMVLVVFLPLAYVELKHEHISADLFVRLMSAKMQRTIYIFGSLISILFFSILTLQTFKDAINAWLIDEVLMGSMYISIWPAKFSLPIGFLAIILVLILHTWKALIDPEFNPQPADPESEGI